MAEWIEECKAKYVKYLLAGALVHVKYTEAEGGELSERGLRALYKLNKKEKEERDKFISAKRIKERAGIDSSQTSAGMWNWLDAGIVEKRVEGGERKYRIRKEFYQAVERVLSEQ